MASQRMCSRVGGGARRSIHRPAGRAGAAGAGTPGYAPYPTTLRLAISPRRLLRTATGFGLEVLHLGRFEDPKQRRVRDRFRITGPAWRGAVAVKALSLGFLDAARTDLVLVLRRPEP